MRVLLRQRQALVRCKVCQASIPSLTRGRPMPPTPFSAAYAEPSAPTDHRKSSSAPFGVFGSDRRTSSGIERHAALQTLARCLRCLREDHSRPPMHPTSRDRAHRTQPVIKCQHCEDTRQYLTKECFLAPLSAAAADKSAGALAVVAGLIAAVKLARVESAEIRNRSPRVRSIISESITIARMVVEASKAKL